MKQIEQLLVQHCAPTLAGLKTANMFTYCCQNKMELRKILRHCNAHFKHTDLCIMPLRKVNKRTLLYVYHKEQLMRDIQTNEVKAILQKCHYPTHNPMRCLVHLAKRMKSQTDFPHEIGCFLGYPPEDVLGFMENTKTCKCVGCWKVYGDETKAKSTFERYKQCTHAYCKRWENGVSFSQLAGTAYT